MASSGNFATWNPLARTNPAQTYAGSTFLQGNLKFAGTTGGNSVAMSTLYMTSGKWYTEFYQSGSPNGGWPAYGIIKAENATEAQDVSNIQNKSYESHIVHTGYHSKFDVTNSGTNTGDTFTAGDIIQIAIDIDAGKAWWGKNNTWTQSGDPANGNNANDTFTAGTEIAYYTSAYNGCGYIIMNAGQDDTFGGAITAAGNADGNGFGAFKYSPPSGFLALCSANLPISDDIDPAQTDDDIPQKQFGVVTYTGTGSTQAITGLGFQPDLVWIKDLSSGENNRVTDSTRGVTKAIRSDISNAELTDSGGVTAFGTDGFTVGNHNNYNASTNSLVAWCWKANGGTTATDSTGTITSSVQANTKGGFSIVTYTGTGTAATIGHGLGKAPELIFVKNRDAGDDWAVYHVSNGNTHYMILNTNGGKTDNTYWNDTSPTSSVFSIGTDHKLNASTEKYVAYCWAPIEGYSKFGAYTSNQNADGPFNYTGFRPKMIFVKMVVSGDGWGVWDSERSPTNVMDEMLRWDSDNAQATGTPYQVDFGANGFKVRTDNAQMNHNSYDPYIWGAWGDVPYKYNNGF